jgi:hypothetical protein
MLRAMNELPRHHALPVLGFEAGQQRFAPDELLVALPLVTIV